MSDKDEEVYVVSCTNPYGESFVMSIFKTEELAKEYVDWQMNFGFDSRYMLNVRKWTVQTEIKISELV